MADSQGLKAQYQAHYRTLAESESTPDAKAAALAFFRTEFSAADWAPPAYFDQELIDKLIAIVRDEQGALKLRTEAAAALADLLRIRYAGECSPIPHAVVEKGAMELFAACIGTATVDDKLRDACILGARRIFEGCCSCRAVEKDQVVIEAVAAKLLIGTILTSLESTRGAVACVHAAMKPREERYDNMIFTSYRVIIYALAAAMRNFPDDNFVLRHALDSLKWMNKWRETTEIMAAVPGLLEQILLIISTNNSHSVVNPAMSIMLDFKCHLSAWTQPAELARWNRVIALPGFVSILVTRLSSPSLEGQRVRDIAFYLLDCMAEGPDAHIDVLLTDSTAVAAMLRYTLECKERNGHRLYEAQLHSIWFRLAHMLESLMRSPRPALLTNLLGSGVMPFFLDYGKKNEEEDRVAEKLGSILPSLTRMHPEFSGIVEKSGLGHLIPLRGRKVGPADYVIADEEAMEI